MQQFYYTATILVLLGMDINDYPGTTAIWVSLEGCYISLRHNSSRNMMPKNGPRQCFDACPNSTYIGLQDSWCMCDSVGENYALPRYCNYQCSGETDMICGAGLGIAVYSKVNPVQSISVSGDFGCVYVDVSVPSSGIGHTFRLHATNNCSEEHFGAYIHAFISGKCVYERTLETWFKARDKFLSVAGTKFLLPEQYVRNDSCPPQTDQGININSGEFWIGLIWITTDTTTTSMNTMAMISTHLPNTSSTTATTTRTPILTEHQSTKMSAVTSSTIVFTTKGSSPPVNLIAVYIAVPVGVCVVSVVVVVIICWCRKWCCFRSCREGLEDHVEKNHNGVQTGKINNDSPPEIPYMDPLVDANVSPSVPVGSNRATFQGHQENIGPIVSGQTCNQEGHYIGSNAVKYEREMGNSTPNHLESRSEKPGNSFELDDGIHSSASKREKRKDKRRRKKKKQNHRVPAASENGEINGDTDNYLELGRYTNGEHSDERTENPNDVSRYDEKKRTEKEKKKRDYSNEEKRSRSSNPFATLDINIDVKRPATASDIHAVVPTVQEQKTDYLHGSDEVRDELNDNNSESRIEETKKHKRSGNRKKRKKNTLFDVPADHPVVEGQTDINNIGSIIKQNEN